MDNELREYMDAMKAELKADIDGMGAMKGELIGRMDGMSAELNKRMDGTSAELKADIYRLETALLTEFHKWASPAEMRARTHAAVLRAIDLEQLLNPLRPKDS